MGTPSCHSPPLSFHGFLFEPEVKLVRGKTMSCFLMGKESKAGLIYEQKRTFEGKKG